MGRDKNKYRIRRDVYVSWEILESEAFKQLSATAIRVLLKFLQKRTWIKMRKNTIYENGNLVFTYTEAGEIGISRSMFNNILHKLIEVGFIDMEHQALGVTIHALHFLTVGKTTARMLSRLPKRSVFYGPVMMFGRG